MREQGINNFPTHCSALSKSSFDGLRKAVMEEKTVGHGWIQNKWRGIPMKEADGLKRTEERHLTPCPNSPGRKERKFGLQFPIKGESWQSDRIWGFLGFTLYLLISINMRGGGASPACGTIKKKKEKRKMRRKKKECVTVTECVIT